MDEVEITVAAAAFVAAGLFAQAVLAIPPGDYDHGCCNIRESRDGLNASCSGRVYTKNIGGQLRSTTQ